MSINTGLFTSNDETWATPCWLFDALDREFHFDLDAAATPLTAKCERYFTPAEDALAQRWDGRVFLNPPYGRTISNWVNYARCQALNNPLCELVVCLLPARTDTKWWWENCIHAQIRFLRGRVRFGDATNSAPFPSCIVIFSKAVKPGVIFWEVSK